MTKKLKRPAGPLDQQGSTRRPRPIKRITTPGDQAQAGPDAPVLGRTVKYKGEGPPPRQ